MIDIFGIICDVIEEVLDIEGILIIFVDIVGVRKIEDVVEKIGVKKILESIERVDFVFFMIELSGIL